MKKTRASKIPRCSSMEINRKLRKKADKSSITAKRVTLLPGFLSRGVKSETVQKTGNCSEGALVYDDVVLRANLHGLLHEAPPKPRRSSRLSKKNVNIAPSSYYLEAIAEEAEFEPQLPSSNRSKSIFREIKQKYARQVDVNEDFGAKIYARLNQNFSLKDPSFYRSQIFHEIDVIDDVICGKSDPIAMSINRKRHFHEEEKENYSIKFPCVPQSKWVFQTPPNRKLNYNHSKVDENCMKPAILETCKDSKVVYEVNKKINNIDLTQYSNRQEIDIDKRYMVQVANLPNGGEDITFQYHEPEQREEKKFSFIQSDKYELENHFLSLTCRPKKVPMTVSRIATLKRKRDIFEPEAGCSTDLETINEFDSSFTFINSLNSLEESFTFKFTATECSSGATTGHLFDFDGNKKDTFNFHY